MLMEPMPTLVKTFSLVLQQECEFNATFHSNSQDSIANLAFNEGHSKHVRDDFSVIVDEDALLGLVAAIPNIVIIVTLPITHLITIGLSMTCSRLSSKH